MTHLDALLRHRAVDDVFVPGGDATYPAGLTRWIRRVQPRPAARPRRGHADRPRLGGVAGLHLFTFNQLQQAEQWRRAALERTGTSNHYWQDDHD